MAGLKRPEQGILHFILASLATAGLLFLSMPGHTGWWFFLFIGLVPLLIFISRETPRRSFLAGLVTGFVYHTSMLYWIIIVLGRHGGLPPLISVPAMLLLSLYMATYLALFCCLCSSCMNRNKPTRGLPAIFLFASPSLWVGLDWLRGMLFTGFPWMDLGYGLASQPVLIQVADLGGHHLVSFLVVMVNVFIVQLISWRRYGDLFPAGSERRIALIAAGILLLSSGYSLYRFQQVATVASSAQLFNVGVAQGNIDQLDKWVPDHKQTTMNNYLGLSEQIVAGNSLSLIVWPETAIPFFPGNDPLFMEVRRWSDDKDLWLLSGAPHFELKRDLLQSTRTPVRYYNSALLIDPSGEVSGRYEKQHLVPFGEYVPLRRFLPFLDPLVESVGNFSVGRSPAPLSMGDYELGVLICYESIFPALARKKVVAGADVLVNITNDAWYGRSSAPYQSFSMAVLRAVETRRSMVRAANTGISGFVDPVGRTMEASPIFETLSLAASVPVLEAKTVFIRFGYVFGPVCLALSLLLLTVFRRKK